MAPISAAYASPTSHLRPVTLLPMPFVASGVTWSLWPLRKEKLTCRYPLEFPIESERPKPGRRPDILPQFSPMKTALPPPLPSDSLEEEEEEEEKKEEEEEEEDPEKEEPDKPEKQ